MAVKEKEIVSDYTQVNGIRTLGPLERKGELVVGTIERTIGGEEHAMEPCGL